MYIANLITIDEEGFPASRSVVAREYNQDLSVFRLQTRKNTRKIAQIRKNKKIAVTYVDQRGRGGWVTFRGEAELKDRADSGGA
jgi:general stress protein 26